MIYIKTNLKKIPETCKKCTFACFPREGVYDGKLDRYCSVNRPLKYCPTERTPNGNLKYTRPDWCPLVEK